MKRNHAVRGEYNGPRAGPAARRRRNGAGFTLVELLVVIAIIGVLIALTMPALRGARERAQQVACAMNLKQYALAFQMYASENKGLFPSHFEAVPAWTPWSAQLDEAQVLLHSQQEALACPASRLRVYHENQCRGKYMYHALMGSHIADAQWARHKSWSIKKPADMAALGDAADFMGNGKARYYFYSMTANGWMYLGFDLHGGANVLFADGHVFSGLRLDTFNPDWASPVYHGF
ncbi:MAG: type II secretion system GspH family protein [Candidatus Marinimicrobia bacterium]|nr:type II secretion system GspH family protein [Candidatus Neomarinimicrobiota bacterium]